MKHVILDRFASNAFAQFGAIANADASKPAFVALEPPPKFALKAGTYRCEITAYDDREFFTIAAEGDRPAVRIRVGHSPEDLRGDILIVRQIGRVGRFTGIEGSAEAFELFMDWVGREPFELTISDPSPEST